ncbi:Dynein axonemal assembly factor 1 [Anthophora retusa]
MQEDSDFQSIFAEKKSSAEIKLDVPASSASLSEREMKNSIPTDSIVDFQVLAASSSDVVTKTVSEWQQKQSTSDRQISTLKSTPELSPEVDNEDDSNWLSYFDCSTIFDVTCENLSYYNSTKAEKDSDSDLDDTLMFDDAEEGDTSILDENDACCTNSFCQQSFEESCEKKIDDFERITIVSNKVSTTEINDDVFLETVNCEDDKNRNESIIDCKVEDEIIYDPNRENVIEKNVEKMDDFDRITIVSNKISTIEINDDVLLETVNCEDDKNQNEYIIECKSEDEIVCDESRENAIERNVATENLRENEDSIESDVKGEYSVILIDKEMIEEVKTEQKSSENFNSSSDSDEENDRNFIYSSSNVNITDYFKYRDSMKEPKFEATLEEADVILSKRGIRRDSITVEEIVEESDSNEKEERKIESDVQEAKEMKVEEILVQDFTESDIKHTDLGSPEEYLGKLAEITESVCPKTEEEVQQTLKKIAEGKAEIENRKNEALKDLSVEFNNIEKFVPETKSLDDSSSDSDESVDETKKNIDNIEMPLTKDQVAETFKSKNSEKSTEDEEKRRTELLQECLQVIPQKIETDEFSAEKEIVEENTETDEISSESIVSEETEKKTANIVVSGIVADIMADTEDSLFWEFLKEPERTYIKGKVYDFDEKKHTIRMTEEFLKKHCKLNKLYQTPHLNDVLYLHYKGFSFIENLEKYTGLKCLWLENNGIREIANLENQGELKCLYLHNNLINKIENLEYLTQLDTLNLSYNTIRRIENLDSLKFLNTLNLSHNYLQETADIEHLRLLDSLSVLDISHNRIDTDEVVNILGDMKELRVASLMGNPILKRIRLYRKTMILKCKNLKYLDDRPVFPRDRACAEAWMRGGPDEEAAERKRWIEAEQKKINDSVQALINKRKLYKPVETSEKEAEDKKKTKEDEEVATDTSVCTSSELLKLEGRKKKSDDSSSTCSSASSSSDEEMENAEEDRTGQKGAEKSDGRRPMAEEGRKASSEIHEEILLPWNAKVQKDRGTKKLVEEIEETKEHVADDVKKILDEQSIDDPPGGHAPGTEPMAHYEKLVLETSNETNEITPACYNQGTKHDTGEKKSTKDSSVSCDIFYSMDTKGRNEGNIADNAKEESSSNDIMDKNRGKSNSYTLSSQLTSIREDMKEFCADMDKFVEKNKIVFKNGEVEGFWGENIEVNSTIKCYTSDKREEEESSTEMKEGDNFKWWSTKERKLKVKEIMKKREKEVQKSNTEKVAIFEEKLSNDERDEVKKQISASPSVYDLLNLKRCPEILLKDTRTYPENEDNSVYGESNEKEKTEERFSSIFDSFFMEIDQKSGIDMKPEKILKTISSRELLAIEEVEEGVEEAQSSDVVSSTIDTPKLDVDDQETARKKRVKIEILEARPVNSSDDEESDNESVKTVINNYEDPEINVRNDPKLSSDTSKSIEVPSDDEFRNVVAENSNGSTKSHKRARDSDHLSVASKKSHVIEESDLKKESSVGEITVRCRKHMMREAKKFMKKESPLIDKCIESLITNKDNEGKWDLTKCHAEDFLTANSNFLCFRNPESSQKSSYKAENINTGERSDSRTHKQSDIQSIAQLLKESEDAEKSMCKKGKNLFQEFSEYLQYIDSKKKLLIEPDFMKSNRVDPEEKNRDVSSSTETKQSNKKQTEPLIEVISETSTNVNDVDESEESLASLEDYDRMDPALKEKILRNINAPKTDEQRERGKKSADKLKKISREAMAKGKLLLEQASANGNEKIEIDDTRRFFANLLKDDSAQETEDADFNRNTNEEDANAMKEILAQNSQECPIKIDETKELCIVNEDGSQDVKTRHAETENVGTVRKSLEMQVVQQQ